MRKSKKRLVVSLSIAVGAVVLFLVGYSNYVVVRSAEKLTFDSVDKVPYNKVAIVLGTVPLHSDGSRNPYFDARIRAAADLYRNNRVEMILVSGDNDPHRFNEPEVMRDSLMAAGVPVNAIQLDSAGFRTLDSVVRALKVYGIACATVVSQQFHNERAIYLAKNNGLPLVGYNAAPVTGIDGFKTNVREYLARVRAVFDVWSDVQPAYMEDAPNYYRK